MLSSTNFWMSFAGLIYLVAGVLILRKEISAARGWDKLITLGCVFIAVPLAVFAPEHFHGPEFIQNMVPSWMPAHWFWPYFVGCALLAAATSLTVRKFVRLSSTLLGLMFFLFVCMIYMPSALAHLKNRFAWAYALRDLSFAGGAWALAGLHSRAPSPQQSKWMILFGRIVVAIAAIFFAVQHFLHPEFAPGVPLEKMTPLWVPFPSVWGYLAGAILLAAGIGLALNKQSRRAAASIGALVTVLTLFPYLLILVLAHGGSEINEGLNYVADTLLFAGAALVLASALPRDPDRAEKT
ncbi:MAG: DoxX family membrane protein [Acidobacteriia bacterium]|nr:DoxX family membrane protein [Terriglobia bacterium]